MPEMASVDRAFWGHLLLDFKKFNFPFNFDKPSKEISNPL
jgi:hypothetical protein